VRIIRYVSAERDELRRLIEQLPDERVPAALEDVRRRLTPVSARARPPAWFGAGEADRHDLARRHDDLLADGFGQS
jgi:hypothetical protein